MVMVGKIKQPWFSEETEDSHEVREKVESQQLSNLQFLKACNPRKYQQKSGKKL